MTHLYAVVFEEFDQPIEGRLRSLGARRIHGNTFLVQSEDDIDVLKNRLLFRPTVSSDRLWIARLDGWPRTDNFPLVEEWLRKKLLDP